MSTENLAVLHKKGGDLLISLSWALGAPTSTEDPEYITSTFEDTFNANATLIKASDVVNSLK